MHTQFYTVLCLYLTFRLPKKKSIQEITVGSIGPICKYRNTNKLPMFNDYTYK